MSRTVDAHITLENAESGTGATLVLRAGADSTFVRGWLEKRGYSPIPMQDGFYLVGSRRNLEASLGLAGDSVPGELSKDVESIYFAEPSFIHSRIARSPNVGS